VAAGDSQELFDGGAGGGGLRGPLLGLSASGDSVDRSHQLAKQDTELNLRPLGL
jgi:hypothetical protein